MASTTNGHKKTTPGFPRAVPFFRACDQSEDFSRGHEPRVSTLPDSKFVEATSPRKLGCEQESACIEGRSAGNTRNLHDSIANIITPGRTNIIHKDILVTLVAES